MSNSTFWLFKNLLNNDATNVPPQAYRSDSFLKAWAYKNEYKPSKASVLKILSSGKIVFPPDLDQATRTSIISAFGPTYGLALLVGTQDDEALIVKGLKHRFASVNAAAVTNRAFPVGLAPQFAGLITQYGTPEMLCQEHWRSWLATPQGNAVFMKVARRKSANTRDANTRCATFIKHDPQMLEMWLDDGLHPDTLVPSFEAAEAQLQAGYVDPLVKMLFRLEASPDVLVNAIESINIESSAKAKRFIVRYVELAQHRVRKGDWLEDEPNKWFGDQVIAVLKTASRIDVTLDSYTRDAVMSYMSDAEMLQVVDTKSLSNMKSVITQSTDSFELSKQLLMKLTGTDVENNVKVELAVHACNTLSYVNLLEKTIDLLELVIDTPGVSSQTWSRLAMFLSKNFIDSDSEDSQLPLEFARFNYRFREIPALSVFIVEMLSAQEVIELWQAGRLSAKKMVQLPQILEIANLLAVSTTDKPYRIALWHAINNLMSSSPEEALTLIAGFDEIVLDDFDDRTMRSVFGKTAIYGSSAETFKDYSLDVLCEMLNKMTPKVDWASYTIPIFAKQTFIAATKKAVKTKNVDVLLQLLKDLDILAETAKRFWSLDGPYAMIIAERMQNASYTQWEDFVALSETWQGSLEELIEFNLQ